MAAFTCSAVSPSTVAWALGGTMFSRGPPVKDETRGSAASWGQAARKVG